MLVLLFDVPSVFSRENPNFLKLFFGVLLSLTGAGGRQFTGLFLKVTV